MREGSCSAESFILILCTGGLWQRLRNYIIHFLCCERRVAGEIETRGKLHYLPTKRQQDAAFRQQLSVEEERADGCQARNMPMAGHRSPRGIGSGRSCELTKSRHKYSRHALRKARMQIRTCTKADMNVNAFVESVPH